MLGKRRPLRPRRCWRLGHDVSLVSPENAPSPVIFGHIPKPASSHENVGRYLDSGAAHHFRGRIHRPDSDQRSAHSTGELNAPFAVILGDDRHAFGRPISQTHKRARRRDGIPDRIADFRRGVFPSRARADGERVARSPPVYRIAFSRAMIAAFLAMSEPPAMLFDRGFRPGTRDRRLSQFLRGG